MSIKQFIYCVLVVFAVGSSFAEHVDYVGKLNEKAQGSMGIRDNSAARYADAAANVVKGGTLTRAIESNEWVGNLKPDELEALRGWVKDNGKALINVRLAAGKKGYWKQYDCSRVSQMKNNDLEGIIKVADVLCWQAQLNAMKGRTLNAIDSLKVCYKMGIHLENGSAGLVGQFAGTKICDKATQAGYVILAKARMSSIYQKRLQSEITKLLKDRPEDIDYSGEKFGLYDLIQRVFDEEGKAIPLKELDEEEMLAFVPEKRAFRKRYDKDDYNEIENSLKFFMEGSDDSKAATLEAADELYALVAEYVGKEPFELMRNSSRIDKQMEKIAEKSHVVANYLPDIIRIKSRRCESLILMEGLVVSAGLQRYQQEKGNYPKNLSDLVSTGYITSVPIDPFTGKDIIYKRSASSVAIYSAGQNKIDDGGKDRKWPMTGEEGDIVFWPVMVREKINGRVLVKVDYNAKINEIMKPANYKAELDAVAVYKKAFESYVDFSDKIEDTYSPRKASDEELVLFDDWVKANLETFGYIEKAVQMPYLWRKLKKPVNADSVGFWSENRGDYKRMAMAFWHRSKLRAMRGDYRGALKDVAVIEAISEQLSNGKSSMDHLMTTSIELLAMGAIENMLEHEKLNDKTLASIQSYLETSSLCSRKIDIEFEKYYLYDIVQRCYTDDGNGNGELVPKLFMRLMLGENPNESGDYVMQSKDSFLDMQNSPNRKAIMIFIDICYKISDKWHNTEPWKLEEEMGDKKQKLEALANDNIVTQSLLSQSMASLWHRRFGRREALITIIAVKRFEIGRKRLPANLSEVISSGLIKSKPVDPYSGKSFIYKKIEDDFMLYGIGPNLVDDGGKKAKSWSGTSSWGNNEQGDNIYWPFD